MKRRKNNTLAAEVYDFLTGQEIDTLERSASDGKHNLGWETTSDPNRGLSRSYRGDEHQVHISAEGLETADALEQFTMMQDTDFTFTLLYVLGCILPAQPLPANAAPVGWVDLDDVMEKIGWNPAKRSKGERDQMRARIYRYLVYGHRAAVSGNRSGQGYIDKVTKQVLETHINGPVWRIHNVEVETGTTAPTPLPNSSPPSGQLVLDEIVNSTAPAPRRVQIVINKEWEPLLIHSSLKQYLPAAQLLGAIAPNQVAGDWARSIGLALARHWRINPREVLQDKYPPTRRYLLTRYTPKTRTATDILSSANPKRAVDYWCEALTQLVSCHLVKHSGEATRTAASIMERFDGYNWQEAWLDEEVVIMPGDALSVPITELADALPPKISKPLKPSAKTTKKN